MSNIARIAVGVSAIGGVAGGGVLLNKYLSNEDIQSKLKANNFEILSSDNNDALWGRILASYKKVSAEKPEFKFTEATINEKEDLQTQCEEIIKKRIGEDSKDNNYYEKAKRWCTVPTSVSKVLEKERTILDTNPDNDKANQDEWDKKIKNYTATTNKDKIATLDLGRETITSVQASHRTKIKQECKKLNEKESFEEEYQLAIDKARAWCTIEKKAT